MSPENIEVTRAGYVALNNQEFDRWLSILAEDVELHELASIPDSSVHHGHGGVRAWYEAGLEVFEDLRFELDEIRDHGETVVTRVRACGQGRGGGVPFEHRVFHVLDFRDGVVWRVRAYLDESEARWTTGISGAVLPPVPS